MRHRPTQPIPALDDATNYSDVDRGSLFLGALEQVGLSVVGATVADLGTGFGSIAIAAAKRGARVWAVDVDSDRLSVVRGRARAAEVEPKPSRVTFLIFRRASGRPISPFSSVSLSMQDYGTRTHPSMNSSNVC